MNRISDSSVIKFMIPGLIVILLAVYFGFNLQFPDYDLKVDRDEALEISARNLLKGDFLYAEQTPAGNPVTPLPGAVIIFLPFYFAGGVIAMNSLMLVLLFIFASRFAGFRIGAFYIILLVTSPVFLHEWIFEGDLIANTIYVLLLFGLVFELKNDSSILKKIVYVFLAGLSLASRPVYFIILMPILFSYKRLPESINLIILSACISVLLIAGSYSLSPGIFAPLHVSNFLYSQYNLTIIIISILLLIYAFIRRDKVSFSSYLETVSAGLIIVLVVQSIYRFIVYTQEDIYLFRERYPLFFLIPLLLSLVIKRFDYTASEK